MVRCRAVGLSQHGIRRRARTRCSLYTLTVWRTMITQRNIKYVLVACVHLHQVSCSCECRVFVHACCLSYAYIFNACAS